MEKQQQIICKKCNWQGILRDAIKKRKAIFMFDKKKDIYFCPKCDTPVNFIRV